MARAMIYTLEPLEHGGVMAKVRVAAELLRAHGHSVELLFTATEQVPVGGVGEKLRYFARHPLPYYAEYQGFPCQAVPHYPLPIWLTYALPTVLARGSFISHDIHLVISGANHCGLPAALTRRRYLVWIGTLYDDELLGKALNGDRWAAAMRRGLPAEILRREEQMVFARAARVLSNGQHTADRIAQVYPHLTTPVETMIYPVDTDLFVPTDAPHDDSGPRYLLFTARINDVRKNVGLLFRTLARLHTQHPDLRLVVTGDAPDARVQAALVEAGVGGAVDFVGRQTVEQLVVLYQGAAAFVLPSNQEGLGISMLEAMACGLPVVSTRCGGPESVIRDGETGFLTPLDDEIALAERIGQLLNNRGLRDTMGRAAARAARQHFSRAVIRDRLLAAFAHVYPHNFPH